MTVIHHRALPALLLLMAGASPALAQAVAWRTDYAKAVTESAQQGKPLFINVGSDNCYWCRQLDSRTFIDGALAKMLNDRCIPLKVNGTHNRYLVQALRIQSYPTLIFASSDGTIVSYKEGFQEVATLKQQVLSVLAAVGTPDWMRRDHEMAEKALASGDHGRAISLLRNIVEDGKDRPIQVKARQLITEIEKKAAVAAANANDLVAQGKTAEAIAAYNRVDQQYPGTLAARQGRQQLAKLTSKSTISSNDRRRQAAELLELARKDYREQRLLICLDRCELLLEGYPELAEAKDAEKLADQIKDNPEWTRKACEQLGSRLSVLYLALADAWLKKGQPQQAVFYLERIIKIFPGTRHAEAAQVKLTRLRGTPDAPK
jgi:tetratricopeptide (TPR) repeat protein